MGLNSVIYSLNYKRGRGGYFRGFQRYRQSKLFCSVNIQADWTTLIIAKLNYSRCGVWLKYQNNRIIGCEDDHRPSVASLASLAWCLASLTSRS